MIKTFAVHYPTFFVIPSGLALILCQYLWRSVMPELPVDIRIVFEKATSCLLAIVLLSVFGRWCFFTDCKI
jgi:hypothetical protein